MITVKNLSLSHGGQTIFDEASFSLTSNARCGLVGPNGTGKTTLLRILAKLDKPDSGTFHQDAQQRIAYLPQHITFDSAQTALEEINSENHFEETSVYARNKKILAGLGFSETLMHAPVHALSTGWKMRLLLAKLLAQDADLYLFDEPTNHLDLPTREWFVSFLRNAPFGFVIVSHDKHVLNALCSTIIEIDQTKTKTYQGNYDRYRAQKVIDQEQQLKAYEQQQKERAKKVATIDRFKAKANKARMAQSMLKKLDAEEMLEAPTQQNAEIHLTFSALPNAPRIILDAQHIEHTFGDNTLFKNVKFTIERGDKLAIFAPNGIGKTTLIKILTDELKLQQGTFNWRDGVRYAVFHQEQTDSMNPKKTIWETVNSTSNKPEKYVHALLGALLFSDDTVDKPLGVLSGGEKVRVKLAQMLMKDANVLILDEPTNHLDIFAQESLLQVLKNYPGTILFVSHDYDFLNGLATKTLELSQTGAILYQGNYESYKSQKALSNHTATESTNTVAPTRIDNKQKSTVKEIRTVDPVMAESSKKLEQAIEKKEREHATLVKKLESTEFHDQHFATLCEKIKQAEQEIRTLTKEWEELIQ